MDTYLLLIVWLNKLDIGGKYHLEYASTILCKIRTLNHMFGSYPGLLKLSVYSLLPVCISVVLVATVYVIYWYGPVLRRRSPFAQQLVDARAEMHGRIQAQEHS